MKEYKVVSVLWDDHTEISRSGLLKNPEDAIRPTLSIGFIYKQTKRTITLVHDLERFEDRDDASYMVILRATICGIKEHGTIKLESIKIT